MSTSRRGNRSKVRVWIGGLGFLLLTAIIGVLVSDGYAGIKSRLGSGDGPSASPESSPPLGSESSQPPPTEPSPLSIDVEVGSGVLHVPDSKVSELPTVAEMPQIGGPEHLTFVREVQQAGLEAGGIVTNMKVSLAAYGSTGRPIRIERIVLVDGDCFARPNVSWVSVDLYGGGADDSHGMTVNLARDGMPVDNPTGGSVLTANGLEKWQFPRQVGPTEERYLVGVIAPEGMVCEFALAVDYVFAGEPQREIVSGVNGAPFRAASGAEPFAEREVKYPY